MQRGVKLPVGFADGRVHPAILFRCLEVLGGCVFAVGQPAIASLPTLSTQTSPTSSLSLTTPPTPMLISQVTGSTLQFGDTGSEVQALQSRLATLGFYTGPIDGDFGSGTERAVIQFQQSRGLTADGVVGAATRSALFSGSGTGTGTGSGTGSGTGTSTNYGTDILRRGSNGLAVETLQQRLQQLGFYDGPITGDFGDRTESGVIAFQRSHNLTADGIVGSSTYAALNNPSRPGTGTPGTGTPGTGTPGTGTPGTGTPGTGTPGQVGDTIGRYSVLDLQRRLYNRGYYSGAIDGILGVSTMDAIDEAQTDYNLTPNDVINSNQ